MNCLHGRMWKRCAALGGAHPATEEPAVNFTTFSSRDGSPLNENSASGSLARDASL